MSLFHYELGIELVDLKQANNYVKMFHRHSNPVVGHKFALGILRTNALYSALEGVAIVGRPVARMLDDGDTLEVTRLVMAHKLPNACSFAYAWCNRIRKRMGYRKLITYTLASESGVSLIAAGWKPVARTAGGSWHRRARARVDRHPTCEKIRWEAP